MAGMTIRRTLPALLLLLAACGSAPAAPPWSMIDAPVLGVRFLHPSALTVESEDVEDQSIVWDGGTDKTYGFFVPEGHIPEGIADWSLPAGFAEALADQPSCTMLEGEGTYLPVNFAEPHVCEVVLRGDGGKAVYAIGFGRPYEGLTFLESLLLVPTEQGVVAIQGIAPLSPFPPEADELLDAHPGIEFPSEEFHEANTQLTALLRKMLSAPSPAIREAATAVWRIAQSLERTETPSGEDAASAE